MNEFYKRFCELCAQKNVSASGAAIAIGLSNAAASGWKKGKLPSDVTCEKLAAYFDVDINYLMCDQKENPTDKNGEVAGGLGDTKYFKLNDENRALIDSMIEKLLKSQSDD